MKIVAHAIDLLAPNVVAAKNGRDLVSKNKFSNLKISSNGFIIWGECAGNGDNLYFCSADYTDGDNPVFSCSCPSKQFPCKHNIGLLYAFEKNLPFAIAEIPEIIINKRAKIKKHIEKQEQEISDVRKDSTKRGENSKNIKSIVKKIETQLSGIEIAKKLLYNIVQMGLSGIDATVGRTVDERIKELGNYHIEGIQLAFNNLLVELKEVKNDQYTNVINQLNYISTLLKKSGEYLITKKENPEANPELTSSIEEQTGYVWKLANLKKYGMYEENAEIIQLSYNTYDYIARKSFVDEGYWFNLKTGKIYKSKNYRPYQALRYIKEENTCFEVLKIPELYIYPGDVNPRVRWESMKLRLATDEDRTKAINAAASDYAETVKTAKSFIKNPLMEKNPVVLLKLNRAYLAGESVMLEDKKGNRLTVNDLPEQQIYTETALKAILPEECDNIALTAMINNNLTTGIFSVTALSLITDIKIIRLLY
jgi:hypothetical protein